jgi:mRNA interferase MazF
MNRAEVWWVSFGPSIGGEIQKTRPAIIVSRNEANQALNRLQVVPVTTNINRLFPSEAYVFINGKPHKAMADQLATVSKSRLKDQMGTISDEDMEAVEGALKFQLGLL